MAGFSGNGQGGGLASLLSGGGQPGGQGGMVGGLSGAAQMLLQQLMQREMLAKEITKPRTNQPIAPPPPSVAPPPAMPSMQPQGQQLPQFPNAAPQQDIFRHYASIPSEPAPGSPEAAEGQMREDAQNERALRNRFSSQADEQGAGLFNDQVSAEDMQRVQDDLSVSEKEAYINTLIQEIDGLMQGPDSPEREQRIQELMMEVERLKAE